MFVYIAWAMRPRIAKLPTVNIAYRRQYPALHTLVDQIAEALGAGQVDMIVLDCNFNASFNRAGWRRKDVLTIGLPLFKILAPQERIALLAHEIGHGVNGDPTRGFIVGTALNSLNEWYRILQLSVGIVAAIPGLWLYTLALLMFRDQQKAEYLADHLAAGVAGTEGQLGLLRKLHMYDDVHMTIRRFYLNNSKGNLFDAIKARITNVPQRELVRLDKMERLEDSILDATHPPTAFRIDLLNAHKMRDPRVVLCAAENARIDAELAQMEPDGQAQLLNILDSASYY